MNYLTAGGLGLVLDSGDPKIAHIHNRTSDREQTDSGKDVRAHLVMERYAVDEDGNICLTPSVPLHELPDQIELLRTTLDSLVNQAMERCGGARPHLSRGSVCP